MDSLFFLTHLKEYYLHDLKNKEDSPYILLINKMIDAEKSKRSRPSEEYSLSKSKHSLVHSFNTSKSSIETPEPIKHDKGATPH